MKHILLSKSFANLVVVACIYMAIAGAVVQAGDDRLTIGFTTTAPGGHYQPKNVHVVYLTTTTNQFVTTVGNGTGTRRALWANPRANELRQWYTSNPNTSADVDARTAATRSSHRSYNITWDWRRINGTSIPDGTYKLKFELTDDDYSKNRFHRTEFTVTKGESAWTIGPVNQGGYNNVTIAFVPADLSVDNTEATNVTASSARLNGEVTGRSLSGEDPAVYIYWGDNDGGTAAGAWDNEISLGTMGEAPFYADIAGLSYGRTYYYRCYVQDSTKSAWAPSTESFRAVTVRTVFEEGDIWRYFKGYSTPAFWKARDLDNFEGWLSGPTGIGYSDGDDATVLEDMEDHYWTVYMRYKFQVDSPADVTSLIFTVDYDDGYVAFINAEEVSRSEGLPQGQTYNTSAPNHEAGEPEVIDISEHIAKLVQGDNVFAIEVHNATFSSSDLSMIPTLVMTGGLRVSQADISLVPDALAFSSVAVGSQRDLTFDIKNIGNLPLEVQSLEVVGLDKSAYSLVSPPGVPFSLPALTGVQSVTTRFTPSGARGYNYASVAVGSDDPDEPVASVLLSGGGVALPQKSLAISGSLGGNSLVVAVKGDHSLLGQGATLTIIDTSSPSDPTAVGQVRLADVIRGAAVLGDTAYAAGGSSGLMPVDIADLSSPKALNVSDTPGYAYGVAASGTTLCVADGPGGLAVYDISTPNEPALRSTYQTQGSARAVALSGTTAYVLDDQLGLQIVDVAGVTGALLGSCDEIELGRSLVLFGTYAYITDSLGDFFVVDVANPASPTLRGQTHLAVQGRSVSVMSLAYYNVAYVAGGEAGVQGVLLSNPDVPLPLGVYDTSGQASDLVVSGSQVHVADGSAGLEILNVVDAFAPMVQLGWYRLQSTPYAAAVGVNTYVAGGNSGFQTMDLSSPRSPVLLSVLDTSLAGDIYDDSIVDFFDFSLLGDDWLAAGGLLAGDIHPDGTVNALDLAKLAAEWLRIERMDEVQGVAISGTTAYLANGRSGLQIVDMSNASQPRIAGDYATQGVASCVAVSGTVVIVADGVSAYILDVTNSSAPSLIGRWASDGWAHGVAIDGSFGYVANGSRGLQVLSLADAGALGSYDTPGVAFGVTVSGNTAYVADGPGGVQILDLTSPASPSFVSAFETDGSATGATIAGSYLYVAAGSSFSVVDVSNAAAPSLYARSLVPVRSLSTAVSGSQIIVSDDRGGLVILGLADYTAPLPGAATNPDPPHELVGVGNTPVLTWQAGDGATSHDVYFGESNPPEFRGNQTETTFEPGALYYYRQYFWRIDEVSPAGKTTGPVWTFTVQAGGNR